MSENSENTNNGFGRRSDLPLNSEPMEAQSPTKALQAKEVPPPPKRSKSAKGNFIVFMNFMMSCLVLVVLGAGLVFLYGKSVFEAAGPLTEPQTVVIKEGSSLSQISSKLLSNDVIDNGWIEAK